VQLHHKVQLDLSAVHMGVVEIRFLRRYRQQSKQYIGRLLLHVVGKILVLHMHVKLVGWLVDLASACTYYTYVRRAQNVNSREIS
jgi:hypothetical protein